ncbi:MAG: hypothetical protein A3C36_02660 [Omnitrophica WOR_2 bacterium RIFCSPHIGHO2_02_FULL_52_10]|nr:MAG: hypothetical protein A3C36_02660 [Omnitrophica WOR_2 bacterium RIFCSPHIGHO2_02_FULL_52_10]
MVKITAKSGDKLLIILLALSVLMLGQIMKENVISIRRAAQSGSAKPRVDVDKVKAQLQQAGLKPYEAKYWEMMGGQPPKD